MHRHRDIDKYWANMKRYVAEQSKYTLKDINSMDLFEFFTLLTVLEENAK